MVPETWGIDNLVQNPPIKYDEDAAPIKTYCRECGHETGEERLHAKDCPCFSCAANRRLARLFSAGGKPITFRKYAPISGEDL